MLLLSNNTLCNLITTLCILHDPEDKGSMRLCNITNYQLT